MVKWQSILEQALSEWWPRIFGYHLLKVGALSQELDSRLCPIECQISADIDYGLSLRMEPTHLPFKSHVIDACLLSGLLEFHQSPLSVLREVDRCLVPAGHLVLIGFNPLSPLVLGQLMPHLRKRPPWCSRFFMPTSERLAGAVGLSADPR